MFAWIRAWFVWSAMGCVKQSYSLKERLSILIGLWMPHSFEVELREVVKHKKTKIEDRDAWIHANPQLLLGADFDGYSIPIIPNCLLDDVSKDFKLTDDHFKTSITILTESNDQLRNENRLMRDRIIQDYQDGKLTLNQTRWYTYGYKPIDEPADYLIKRGSDHEDKR